MNALSPGKNPPDEINVVIEIPKGSNIKYEIHPKIGILFVDRILSVAMSYPCNYGFIPKTKEKDGDPLDVFVIGDPVIPMSIIRANPIGLLLTEDQEGLDSKIIAVPIIQIDPSSSVYLDAYTISEPMSKQIEHFIEHHKDLEKGKYVKIISWEGKESAKKKISASLHEYNRT